MKRVDFQTNLIKVFGFFTFNTRIFTIENHSSRNGFGLVGCQHRQNIFLYNVSNVVKCF